MELILDEEDTRELASALRLHLAELYTELVHTDDRAFRASLRGTIERLERIVARVAPAPAPAPTPQPGAAW